MADVIGPNSYLPGYVLLIPQGQTCDEHPERPAIKRVVGETDSFGSECIDMCSECYTKYQADCSTADYSGKCDWCKKHSEHLYNHRDIEEGSCGRVYSVCRTCIEEERQRWADEDAANR